MRNWVFGVLFLVLILTIGCSFDSQSLDPADPEEAGFLGRWDVTVAAAEGGQRRYCWLELRQDEVGTLAGRFNSGGGAAFRLSGPEIREGELRFQHTQGRGPQQVEVVYLARLVSPDRLEGSVTIGDQAPRPWTGIRAPEWPESLPSRTLGEPIELFNGKDLTGWIGQWPDQPTGWKVEDGILVNEPPANNIYSEPRFEDFKVEVEFNVDENSNSGLYLRGRYEVQIIDMAERPLDVQSQGAIYGFIAPSVNAARPAGEWQTLEATLIANHVEVIHNGIPIVKGRIPGITGGALDANQAEPGPIMIQGDHGRVRFRKITVTPLH